MKEITGPNQQKPNKFFDRAIEKGEKEA